jgi:hypothetical protein
MALSEYMTCTWYSPAAMGNCSILTGGYSIKENTIMNRSPIIQNGTIRPLMGMLFLWSVALAGSETTELLAHWRFEQIQHLRGDPAPSVADEPLTADNRGPTEPQPYIFDSSGKGNVLQVRSSRPSPNVFSENVPSATVDGRPNTQTVEGASVRPKQ